MKKEKRSFGISIGSSSILVVFVVLCLTTFATLSLVSANADYKLSRKTADAAAVYYELDAAGEQLLSDLSDVLDSVRPAGAEMDSFANEEEACRLALEAALRDLNDPDLQTRDLFLSVSEDGQWIVSCAVLREDGWSLQMQLDVTGRYWQNRADAKIARLLWQSVPPVETEGEAGLPVFQPGNLPVG
ncbi:MAG: hypothetical protein PHE47_05020 [Oscillospiraceae bacterium]|nr:hypothetical protein [Oscillospiraceae bacterium]